MTVLGLRFCARAFSSCGKRGPLFITVRGLLTFAASLVVEHRLQTHRLSIIVAHGPSRSAACGIFRDQGSNPCPLHWQADSQPLRHQGSPHKCFLTRITLQCFQELIDSCIPLPNFAEDLLPARCLPSGVVKHFLDFKCLRLCGPYTVSVASPPLFSSTTFRNVRTIISSQSHRSRLSA